MAADTPPAPTPAPKCAATSRSGRPCGGPLGHAGVHWTALRDVLAPAPAPAPSERCACLCPNTSALRCTLPPFHSGKHASPLENGRAEWPNFGPETCETCGLEILVGGRPHDHAPAPSERWPCKHGWYTCTECYADAIVLPAKPAPAPAPKITPEQRERLEYLRSKPPVRQESPEVPVHIIVASEYPNPYREGTEEHDEIEALRAAAARRSAPAPAGAAVLTRSERIREDQKKGTGKVTAVMVSRELCEHGYTTDDCYGCDAVREKARADKAEAEVESMRRNGDRALRDAYAQRDALLKALREIEKWMKNCIAPIHRSERIESIAAAAIKVAENA